MFEAISYYTLQQYWWVIVSLLGALLVFLMFVQGGQTLVYVLGKNEEERKLLVNSLGRKWELTFTTLVTFGGAAFAAFPKFYSTSFGGAYWLWIAILFCFVIQAVSYEFRTKSGNFLGQRTYENFLFINGSLGVILIGIAVGTFYTGSDFKLTNMNVVYWQNNMRGIEASLDLLNLSLGLALYFLVRILAAQYFISNINNDEIVKRARMVIRAAIVPFLLFFLFFVIWLMLSHGYAWNPTNGIVYSQAYKYFHNMIEMPVVAVLFVLGVLLVLYSLYLSLLVKSEKAIWAGGSGTVLTVFSLLLCAGLNYTSFYPSTADYSSSLTIANSSSSQFTLTVMSYVSLFVPFVLAYIIYVWRLMDKKKIDHSDMDSSSY